MADMNLTPARASLTPVHWDSRFFTEYVRKNKFVKYMGTSINDMIQVKEDLTRKVGDTIVFPAVRRLKGAGVQGNQLLEGNEELLDARSMRLSIGVFRHAVAVSEWDEQKSVIDLRDAARDALQVWMLEKMKADLLMGLTAITANGSIAIPYAAATAAQKNAWQVNNADRVLFGHRRSNGSSGVHSTSLATITAADGKMTAGKVSLAKRMAQNANPRIRPIRVDSDGSEWFVLFVNSWQMRDLRADPVMFNAMKDAETRGRNNPLFTAGDLVWNGVIIREIEDLQLTIIPGAGAGTPAIDVAPALLCGAQALGIAWAQRSRTTTNVRDYGFLHGVGVQEMRGIGKLRFGKDPDVEDSVPVDQGMVTMFTASVADE